MLVRRQAKEEENHLSELRLRRGADRYALTRINTPEKDEHAGFTMAPNFLLKKDDYAFVDFDRAVFNSVLSNAIHQGRHYFTPLTRRCIPEYYGGEDAPTKRSL